MLIRKFRFNSRKVIEKDRYQNQIKQNKYNSKKNLKSRRKMNMLINQM